MAYDIEAMKKRAAQAKSGGRFWKPPEGRTKVRILSGDVGNCDEGTFFRAIHNHNIKFPDGFKRIQVTKKGWSPIEACQKLFSESGMSDESKSLKPRTSFAMNIIVHGSEDVQVWSCSGTQMDKLLLIMADEDWGDFTDPDDGFCISVDRKGEGLATRYDVAASKTSGELPEEWEKNANDLQEEEGDEIDPKILIAMLADKYEDKYEDLASELMSARRRWMKENKPNNGKKKKVKNKNA